MLNYNKCYNFIVDNNKKLMRITRVVTLKYRKIKIACRTEIVNQDGS